MWYPIRMQSELNKCSLNKWCYDREKRWTKAKGREQRTFVLLFRWRVGHAPRWAAKWKVDKQIFLPWALMCALWNTRSWLYWRQVIKAIRRHVIWLPQPTPQFTEFHPQEKDVSWFKALLCQGLLGGNFGASHHNLVRKANILMYRKEESKTPLHRFTKINRKHTFC